MGNSHDRRKEQKIVERVVKMRNLDSTGSKKPIDSWLQLGGTAVGLAVVIYPERTPIFVVGALMLMFVCFIHPVLNFWWIEDKMWRRITGALALLILLSAYGYWVWPAPRYLEFTKKQRDQFITTLRERFSPHQKVRIGCGTDEKICTAASNLVSLFQEANWTVSGNKVERGSLQLPKAGIAMTAHGSGYIPDPDNPKWGLWVAFKEEQKCIVKAFGGMGLTVNFPPMADPYILDGEILLVVGPEPK